MARTSEESERSQFSLSSLQTKKPSAEKTSTPLRTRVRGFLPFRASPSHSIDIRQRVSRAFCTLSRSLQHGGQCPGRGACFSLHCSEPLGPADTRFCKDPILNMWVRPRSLHQPHCRPFAIPYNIQLATTITSLQDVIGNPHSYHSRNFCNYQTFC